MGRLPTGQRNYEIEKMWSVHHEIARLALIGWKSVDIARHLSVTPEMVSYTLNSSVVKRQLDVMQGARDVDAVDISKKIAALQERAVDALDNLLDSEVQSIKLRTAQDLLDRGGYGAVKKIEAVHAYLSKDDIQDIKNRARDIGLCIDVSAQPA